MPINGVRNKTATQAFSLLEVLLCMALFGFMIVITDLPLHFALHSEQQLSQIDRANRALADVAAALSVVDYQSTFLNEWPIQLRQAMPGIDIHYHFQTAHTIWLQLNWPAQPGLPSALHRLQRTVVFI